MNKYNILTVIIVIIITYSILRIFFYNKEHYVGKQHLQKLKSNTGLNNDLTDLTNILQSVQDAKKNNPVENIKNNNFVYSANTCAMQLANQSNLFTNQMNDMVDDNKNILEQNIKKCDERETELSKNYSNVIKQKQNEITDLTYQISNLENALVDEKVLNNNYQKILQEKKLENNNLKQQLISNRTSIFDKNEW